MGSSNDNRAAVIDDLSLTAARMSLLLPMSSSVPVLVIAGPVWPDPPGACLPAVPAGDVQAVTDVVVHAGGHSRCVVLGPDADVAGQGHGVPAASRISLVWLCMRPGSRPGCTFLICQSTVPARN